MRGFYPRATSTHTSPMARRTWARSPIESSAREGMIVSGKPDCGNSENGTGDPVPDGEVGEVVVTTFNRDYPLVRFATGDLSSVLTGVSACGRTNTRIKGLAGRADQTTKVRGLFVHPQQVAEIVRRHAGICARLVVDQVDGADAMTLHCESANGLDARNRCRKRARSDKAACRRVRRGGGQLPNDGKVIEDRRKIGVEWSRLFFHQFLSLSIPLFQRESALQRVSQSSTCVQTIQLLLPPLKKGNED